MVAFGFCVDKVDVFTPIYTLRAPGHGSPIGAYRGPQQWGLELLVFDMTREVQCLATNPSGNQV